MFTLFMFFRWGNRPVRTDASDLRAKDGAGNEQKIIEEVAVGIAQNAVEGKLGVLSNPQILAGYYDAKPTEATETIRAWMRDAASLQKSYGVMYTTWRNDYSQLEAFAECVKTEWKASFSPPTEK